MVLRYLYIYLYIHANVNGVQTNINFCIDVEIDVSKSTQTGMEGETAEICADAVNTLGGFLQDVEVDFSITPGTAGNLV